MYPILSNAFRSLAEARLVRHSLLIYTTYGHMGRPVGYSPRQLTVALGLCLSKVDVSEKEQVQPAIRGLSELPYYN